MKIEGKEYRTIWFENNVVKIIDQTKLPHQFIIKDLKTIKDAINAIKVMEVRGAPLIGGTAEAAAKLVEISNSKVAAFVFVINLFDLGGSDSLVKNNYKVENLIDFPGH